MLSIACIEQKCVCEFQYFHVRVGVTLGSCLFIRWVTILAICDFLWYSHGRDGVVKECATVTAGFSDELFAGGAGGIWKRAEAVFVVVAVTVFQSGSASTGVEVFDLTGKVNDILFHLCDDLVEFCVSRQCGGHQHKEQRGEEKKIRHR